VIALPQCGRVSFQTRGLATLAALLVASPRTCSVFSVASICQAKAKKTAFSDEGRDFGRFSKRRRFNTDQVPFNFDATNRRTWSHYSDRKQGNVGLACGIKDASKRFGTLQVTICADPREPLPPVSMIFRGALLVHLVRGQNDLK